jgi:hypothetical protein
MGLGAGRGLIRKSRPGALPAARRGVGEVSGGLRTPEDTPDRTVTK